MPKLPPNTPRNKLIFALGMLAVAIAGYAVTSKFANPPSQTVRTLTVAGSYGCVPERQIQDEIQLECVHGIRADEGAWYILDESTPEAAALKDAQSGKRMRIEGPLITMEELSTSQWQKYDAYGIIKVASVVNL